MPDNVSNQRWEGGAGRSKPRQGDALFRDDVLTSQVMALEAA